jgi:hypothetical protein
LNHDARRLFLSIAVGTLIGRVRVGLLIFSQEYPATNIGLGQYV